MGGEGRSKKAFGESDTLCRAESWRVGCPAEELPSPFSHTILTSSFLRYLQVWQHDTATRRRSTGIRPSTTSSAPTSLWVFMGKPVNGALGFRGDARNLDSQSLHVDHWIVKQSRLFANSRIPRPLLISLAACKAQIAGALRQISIIG